MERLCSSYSRRVENSKCISCLQASSRDAGAQRGICTTRIAPKPLLRPTSARPFVIPATSAVASASLSNVAEDKWIAQTLDAATGLRASQDSGTIPPSLATLRSSCASALATLRMPTTRNEEYRFTDLAPLLQVLMQTPSPASPDQISASVASRRTKQSLAATIVIVDGSINSINISTDIPSGVYIGPIAQAPSDIVNFALGTQSKSRGGPFATLNGAMADEVVIIHIPSGVTVIQPIHVLYLSSSSSSADTKSVSAPRALIVVEEGASAEVIEEFGPIDENKGNYLVSAVTEIELDDRAMLKHQYIELESSGAAHFKSTLVNQGQESHYSMIEARVGGSLTRHDLGIDQLGESTETVMKSFLLAGDNQLHDLHSKLKLDHPNGAAEQLHKCIATQPSSRGVFDGNVRVNRLAQRTDAQQLSRNLLLAPRATVNVKPNLQIVADDVKCSHGCSVSDLEEEELFYLRSRGISEEAARQVLVYSFGRDVVQHLKDESLIERVEMGTRQALVSSKR